MQVRFWGVRGSVPTPGPSTVLTGGNTSCVEIRTDAGALLIFDCGTGLRELGRSLLAAGQPVEGHIFISHTHWDHIQGFPFFGPALRPGNRFVLHGARHLDRSLEAALAGQMESVYFPITLRQMAADLEFRELDGAPVAVADAVVRYQYVNHTLACLAYRIEVNGRSIVYATDTEPHTGHFHGVTGTAPEAAEALQRMAAEADQRLAEFVTGADLLIMDAQYTLAEYPAKRGWGHSHLEYVMDIAQHGGVKRLALFHHDPERDDERLAAVEAHCRSLVPPGVEMQVFAAREGMVISI
ncbi:MAG: MBL fold metallo-hydrolase [Chloroflexi bacterium]|nr:MBL fold metallo-hydrolase [Chloroflexota bacterium]